MPDDDDLFDGALVFGPGRNPPDSMLPRRNFESEQEFWADEDARRAEDESDVPTGPLRRSG